MNGAGVSPESPEPLELKTGEDAYAILKNRDFVLYAVGRFIAAFGQQMLAVTVGWEIYARTGRPIDLGFVGLVQVVPMFLFTFPSGYVADHYNRRRIVLWTLAVVCLTSIGLTIVSRQSLSVWLMYTCLFISASSRTFLWSATASLMPQLVSRKQFNRAVTWNSGLFQIAASVGPILGTKVVDWAGGGHPPPSAAAWVYGANVVASFIAIVLIWMVRAHHKPAAKEDLTLESILAGLRFIFRAKIVLGSITLDLFAVLLGSATAILPVYAAKVLHTIGASELGWLRAALPLGSLLMSAILLHRPPLKKAGQTLLWSVVVFGLATIGFGVSKIFWVSFAMLFISGMADYISVVVRHTLVQLQTPDAMRGRVSAVNNLFIGTSNEMGDLETGVVTQMTSPIFAVVSGGIGTIIVVICAAIAWPQLRKYGRLDA
jgi:MFS family permease